jgi:hypothetical protein
MIHQEYTPYVFFEDARDTSNGSIARMGAMRAYREGRPFTHVAKKKKNGGYGRVSRVVATLPAARATEDILY